MALVYWRGHYVGKADAVGPPIIVDKESTAHQVLAMNVEHDESFLVLIGAKRDENEANPYVA